MSHPQDEAVPSELPQVDEDAHDEPTAIRPAAMLEALDSAIAHALASAADRSATVPSLLRMGHWLGFTETDVMTAIARAIEHDPDPSLDPDRLVHVLAETVSAVQLVDNPFVFERVPMIADLIARDVYNPEG